MHKENKHFLWSIMENKLGSIMEMKPLVLNEQHQAVPGTNLKSYHKGVLLILFSERVVQLIGKDSSVSNLQEDAVFLGGKINKAGLGSTEPPGKQVSLHVVG